MAIAAEEDPVYGKVGSFIIKKSDFERIVGYYNPQFQQNLAAHPQQKMATLKRILESNVIAERARKEGFDKKPEVREKLQYVLDEFLAQEYMRNIVLKDVNVTEEETMKYYKDNEKNSLFPNR
jgi:peptidyl-prolyl cis-trans isomerase C